MKSLRGLIALLAVVWAVPAIAGGPFEGLGGSWTGGGRITPAKKKPEPTSCSRSGTVSNSGRNFSLRVACSSESERFSLSCVFIAKSGNNISGNCTANGIVSVNVSGTAGNGVMSAGGISSWNTSCRFRIRKNTMRFWSPDGKRVRELAIASK